MVEVSVEEKELEGGARFSIPKYLRFTARFD